MRGVWYPWYPCCEPRGWVSRDVGQILCLQMMDGSDSLAPVVPFSYFRLDSYCHSDLLGGPFRLILPEVNWVGDEKRPRDKSPRRTSPEGENAYDYPKVWQR